MTNDGIGIRKMSIEDYDRVYALWLTCTGMGLNDLDDSREGIGRFLKRNPDTCFVAADGDEIVGAIMVGNDGRRAYVYHTDVHPEYRRRGIAGRLVEAALAELEKLDIHKVALVTFERNKEGNRFWERRGFTARDEPVYRNGALTEMARYDT